MQAYGWRAAGLEGAFEQLGLGVVSLSARGRIQEMNRKAREILARGDGLISVGRSISAVKKSTQRGLSHAIQRIAASGATPSSGQEIFIERASGKAPYRLTLLPLLPDAAEKYPWAVISQAAAIVLIEDPELRNSVSPEFLQRRYGLTGAEARLAASFSETASLKVSAEALGITEGTARQYLKRIFQKTDTKSQTELMKLLVSEPASLIQR